MQGVRNWNARRRSPSIRALRDAGPPTRWLLVAVVVSLIPMVGLVAAGVTDLRVLLAMPFVALIVGAALDRDGWRARMAMADIAGRQRDRWHWGTLPIDRLSAEAWLEAFPDAPAAARAGVLATAGRHAEARALVDTATPDGPTDAANLARLRILFAAESAHELAIEPAIESLDQSPEMAALSDEDRRYQRLSLAWSLAWLRIRDREPWRVEFATAVRGLGPFRVPWPYRAFHATQHYALAISYALAVLIVSAFGLTSEFA